MNYEIVEDCRVPGLGDFCALACRRADGSLSCEGYIEDPGFAAKICRLLNADEEEAHREHSAGEGK